MFMRYFYKLASREGVYFFRMNESGLKEELKVSGRWGWTGYLDQDLDGYIECTLLELCALVRRYDLEVWRKAFSWSL